MNEHISVMTWNVNGEGGISDERSRIQLDFIDEYAATMDFVMFQAVNYEPRDDGQWGGQLGSLLEYFEAKDEQYRCVHTADWAQELYESDVQPHHAIESAHNRCNLTVSRWPIERRRLLLREFSSPKKLTYYTTHFPEKLLVAEAETDAGDITLWNVAIIHHAGWYEEKVKMLETVYNRIFVQYAESNHDIILGGDFNAPKREGRNGAIEPHGQDDPKYRRFPQYGNPHYFGNSRSEIGEFTYSERRRQAELAMFDSDVGDWGMRDAYWAAAESATRSSEEDYTHEIPNGARKRLDHVLVSDPFDVERCEILNKEIVRDSGVNASDHAPVVAELSYSPKHNGRSDGG